MTRRTAGILFITVVSCLAQERNATSAGEFFDPKGAAAVYFEISDPERTFYFWSEGTPACYMDEDSLYGFNGKHLGWLRDGAVYDHDGNVVVATAARFKDPVELPPPKAPKEYKPYKDYKEHRPYKPVFNHAWSKIAARAFFLQGKK